MAGASLGEYFAHYFVQISRPDAAAGLVEQQPRQLDSLVNVHALGRGGEADRRERQDGEFLREILGVGFGLLSVQGYLNTSVSPLQSYGAFLIAIFIVLAALLAS